MDSQPIPVEWLLRRASLVEFDEVIREYEATFGYFGPSGVPSHAANRLACYQDLRTYANEGCELWWFRSSQEEWDQGFGKAGYAAVLDGEVVANVVTLLN